MGQFEDPEQATSCADRPGIIEVAHATSRSYSWPTRFPRTLRSAAALPQLALARVGAAAEEIRRIGKLSHAAAFFRHSNAAGGRQCESGADACGTSLGRLYARCLRGCPATANG